MSVRTVSVFLKVNAADAKAQLNSASKSLEDLAAKADKTGKVAQTGMGRMVQSAQLQKEAWSTVSTGLLGVGVAAGAMVGVAVKKFADFDQAMSSVQAATHESAANMELLRAAAIEAGADTQYSATEAAGAIDALAKAGISTADILSGGLSGALNLAAAGSMDVGDAAEIAATALTQFKLKGSDVGHVADLLAAGAGKAQGDVTDLGMALKQSGLVASQTGLSIDETTGALSAFASAGLLGSDAGTSFKSMLQRLTPQSAEAQKLMDQLGISAYDAQGNFVGLANFAGNLHDSLKGLTVEQRNSAMATIFGSDAVRAASVFYEQGEAGIQGWIDAVDDSGYAAETAAAKTDNLKGDIERLGGSLETALIKSGSGANDALRGLVQTAEDAVDAFGRLPEGLQQGALGLTALVAAGAGLSGMFMKVVPAIVETKTAMQDLNMSVPVFSTLAQSVGLFRTSLSQGKTALGEFGQTFSMARQLGETNLSALSTASQYSMGGIKSAASGAGSALLGAFGGPVGLAVTGLTVAIGMYAKSQAEAAQFTKALTETLNEQTGALTSSSRAAVAKQLQDKGVLDDARDLGLSLDMVTQAAMGNAEAMDYVAKASGRVSNDALNNNLIPSLDSNYRKMSNVENVTKATADQVEASKEAWDNQSAAVDDSSDSQDDYASSTSIATSAVEDQTSALQDLIDAQREAAGVVMSVDEAQGAWHEQIADNAEVLKKLTGYVDENGNAVAGLGTAVTDSKDAWDLNTEAGRLANSTMLDTSKKAWDVVDSLSAQRASLEDLQAAMQTGRDEFIKTAVQMGMTQAAAEALANQYGLIPDQVTTAVSETGTTPTKTAIQSVIDKINGVPSQKVVGISAIDNASSKIMQIQALINSLGGTTVHVGVSSPSALAAAGHADGGAITGPGTGTSDSILARLSNGEHVLTARDVQAMGGQSGVYRFRQALQAGRVPGYASGGAVTREARVTPSYMSQPRVNVAAPSLEGLALTGSLNINGALVPLVDARIERQQKRFARGPR